MSFGRVHAGEWIAFLCGLLILAGMSLPWYGEDSSFSSVSLLDVILGAVAVFAVLLPFVIAASRLTNVPIVYETALSAFATIGAVLLVIRLIFAPDAGLGIGFYLGLAGAALLTVVGWRSTAREN